MVFHQGLSGSPCSSCAMAAAVAAGGWCMAMDYYKTPKDPGCVFAPKKISTKAVSYET